MKFRTAREWDEQLWSAIEPVYKQAFTHGRKNKKIVKRLLDENRGFLHVGIKDLEVVAMALSATLEDLNGLLIDYLGVKQDKRTKGIGTQFVNYIKEWAMQAKYDGIVIEVESDIKHEPENHPNVRRIRFWEKCGFRITDYLHDYKIVPELYRAMYLNLNSTVPLTKNGEALFPHIAEYHKRAWGGK